MAQMRNGAVLRAAKHRYWREADARVMVEAWRRSGASLSTFARRYGVHGTRIARWASRLASPRSAVRFHPVRVVAAAGRVRPGGDAIEVVLTDGRLVRVPPGFAPEDLHQVLRVLDEGAATC